jgi:rubrerythrin
VGAGVALSGVEKGDTMQPPDTAKDKIILFFDLCAKIEGLCAELYHYYSDVYKDHDDVSRLWKKTALEEENHQKQFELAYRLRDEVGIDLNADLDRICRIHQKASTLLAHVRQSPPDIVTALTKAIEMEENIADLHLDSSVRFHDESIRKMFQALQEFDQDHVKALRHCLAAMTLSKAEMVG